VKKQPFKNYIGGAGFVEIIDCHERQRSNYLSILSLDLHAWDDCVQMPQLRV
jgi:hypothetical protein